jgi:hypothetical protein
MKETIRTSDETTTTTIPDSQAGPQGIGMAVALDWGLAVQLLFVPLLPIFLPGFVSTHSTIPMSSTLVSFLISLPAAILVATFGEGVRRGWKWTRLIQVIFNTLASLAGIVLLFTSWRGILQGNYWSLITLAILLIVSPLIAWRLSRPQTARWFQTVTSAEARRRHGGLWPVFILLWALVGGTLQALTILAK